MDSNDLASKIRDLNAKYLDKTQAWCDPESHHFDVDKLLWRFFEENHPDVAEALKEYNGPWWYA